jgi:hypothetical protein
MKDLIYLMEQNDIQAKAFFVESEEATKAA